MKFIEYNDNMLVNVEKCYAICKRNNKSTDRPMVYYILFKINGENHVWWDFNNRDERNEVFNNIKKNLVSLKLPDISKDFDIITDFSDL